VASVPLPIRDESYFHALQAKTGRGMTTAIIGAGIAGLSAARVLEAAGETVRLYDKGRGPGGRMSTRRAETPVGEARWDHGAQFFTARDEAFREEIVRLREAGAVTRWRPRMADIRKRSDSWTVGVQPSENEREPLFVGTPSMNAVIKAMATDLPIDWGRRVTKIRLDGQHKTLVFEDGGEEGPFDKVICATPAEQAVDLLSGVSDALSAQAARAQSAPCWAVMLAFKEKLPVDWDAANIADGALGWVTRNASKPDRGDTETWVLHASPAWSREHVDLEKDDVMAQLLREFSTMSGAPEPIHVAAHRWLHAKVDKAAGSSFGWDEATGIAVIGDWRSGPRVEAAWLSGLACADFLSSAK